ncbi:MAG: L-histidine N(alpha)-methyltransferase [Planctomycetota bacterium]
MSDARERISITQARQGSEEGEFGREVKSGLEGRPKSLPCRFFYDEQGSRLFEILCTLEEYYPTRAESEILERHAAEIVAAFPAGTALVELGSGSATKTRHLIEAFLAWQGTLRFLPIDISRSALEKSSHSLIGDYATLEIDAIAAEYQEGLRLLEEQAVRPKLILWLGSNIGNFDRTEAVSFLEGVCSLIAPGDGLLLGIDLTKDRSVLELAYDDPGGVTAEFNLNLLARINRELGGDFDLGAFRHVATHDEELGCLAMFLESTKKQRVRIAGLGIEVPFAIGERIHTEHCFKYSLEEIDALGAALGLQKTGQWFDRQRRFCSTLLVAP